jgi:uncharacterized membrane protein (UPF0127 family)
VRHLCQREVRLFAAAAGLLAGVPLTACTQTPQVVIHSAQGTVAVRVEVADTPDMRARGLMYRQDLAPDAGMLFVFPTESEQRFWMKNTPLPLDMVFISRDQSIVGIVPNTHPFSTVPLGVSAPSQYVLEVHAGFCAKHGIGVGDRIELRHVQNSAD